MTVLVAVDSESGNTFEMALEIREAMRSAGADVIMHRINSSEPLNLRRTPDLAFVGAYTWGYGDPPEDTVRFMREHPLDGCKVACFGSGETQWGEEYFCGAVDRLITSYGSPFMGFRQEQMPNSRQRAQLREWAIDIAGQAAGGPAQIRELVGNG